MRYQPRQVLSIGVLVLLPLLLLGVAPALQGLIDRMNALEGQVQTLEGEKQVLQSQVGALEADSVLLQQQVDSVKAESDGELIVIDANGIQVGTGSVVSDGWTEIPFGLDGLPPFILRAAKDRVLGDSEPLFLSSADLFFEARDCLGPPLMTLRVSGGSPLLLPHVFVHESRTDIPIHISDQSATRQGRTLNSAIEFNRPGCSTISYTSGSIVPAINTGIYPLTDYTPPFTVVSRGEFLAMQGGN